MKLIKSWAPHLFTWTRGPRAPLTNTVLPRSPTAAYLLYFYYRLSVPYSPHHLPPQALSSNEAIAAAVSIRSYNYSAFQVTSRPPYDLKFIQTSHLTPHTSHLTPHTSHLTPHTSHLTPHTSHLTPHTSHLTPHTSHLTPHTSHLTPHTSQRGR